MLYLIGQILICLCFAAAIGFAVGWLLRGPGSRAEIETLTGEWRARESALRRDLERQRESNLETQQRLEDAQTAYRRAATGEEKLARALNEAHRKSRPDSKALDAAREELAESRRIGDEHRRQANTLAEALEENREQLRRLETELKAARSAADKAAARAATETPATAPDTSRLVAERDEANARLAQIESRTVDRDKRILDLSRALEAATAHTAVVEEQLATARKTLAQQRAAGPAPAGRGQTRRAPPPAADTRQGTLLPETGRARPAWLLSAPDDKADDLKEIYGIGPVLEATLNRLGIYHFRQIAGLTDDDVTWLAAHIDSFPDRIGRDRWVEQATSLEARRRSGKQE